MCMRDVAVFTAYPICFAVHFLAVIIVLLPQLAPLLLSLLFFLPLQLDDDNFPAAPLDPKAIWEKVHLVTLFSDMYSQIGTHYGQWHNSYFCTSPISLPGLYSYLQLLFDCSSLCPQQVKNMLSGFEVRWLTLTFFYALRSSSIQKVYFALSNRECQWLAIWNNPLNLHSGFHLIVNLTRCF